MSEPKKFAAGIFVEKPSERAPDFVIAKLSFKVAEAIAFLEANQNVAGYCNTDILMSKDGQKYYATLNDFKPEKPASLSTPTDKEDREFDRQFDEEGGAPIPF